MPVPSQSECFPLQPVATPISERQWLSEQGRAHGVFTGKKARIAEVAATGKTKRIRAAVRDFLRDDQVKLSAALRTLGERPDRAVAMQLRDHVNAWAKSYAPIGWEPSLKSDGRVRPICKRIPPELKAVQYMLAAVVEAQFAPSAPVYGVPNHSREDAAYALKALQNQGFTHLAKTDIRDCYQNVSPDALYQLPLPKEVIKHALDTRNLTFEELGGQQDPRGFHGSFFSQGSMTTQDIASGPRGLMQGSPASGIILAWMLNDIPAGTDQVVMLCFDNIVVSATDYAGSREMVNTLFAHFGRHPAGPFALCDVFFADNQPLEFLGYLFDPARDDIGIGEKGRFNLEGRLNEADKIDMVELHRTMIAHRERVTAAPRFWHPPPYRECYPINHWRALRDFRSGFPAAVAHGEELAFYLETT
ncbi:reverse transcriptase domain-containing protein [Allosediminivita pacifica]|uniref:Reverse transcriptase (RNA-dependent DNA polymerase) n=1 Tax=Allosediminivita pacifica TaxID=1267769 RepID=A0A2T5ZV51_9RHOB|nr:reverse transcriptase domain-containing protein [Allosediminivita pacifica]PTX35450.1 hypothetical protein C8N44_1812 [Allosediminivita pacifica]GGB31509.1 hypothetical protein GCM10011324_46110 [Allosediminivita pacifica]